MITNTSFALDARSSTFVEKKVAEGHYGSVSDVVRAGLRLLEDQDARLAALRRALEDGETSGEARPFDFDLFLAEKAAP